MPGQQREVDQRENVVDCIMVLGDSQRPADHRAIRGRIIDGELADDLRRNAGNGGRFADVAAQGACAIILKPHRRATDEVAMFELAVEYFASQGVRNGDVCADVKPDPRVGPLRGRGPARVDDDELCTLAHAFENVVEKNRMRLARVASP